MSDPFIKPFTKAEMDAMRAGTRDEESLKRRFWRSCAAWPARSFRRGSGAAFYCATDPQTPKRVKLILVGAIAYFIFPTDAIADFLPPVGFRTMPPCWLRQLRIGFHYGRAPG